eukprot:Skav213576  [mRNA]  locus=scaffold1790:139152:139460:+ [translate_table: standard]
MCRFGGSFDDLFDAQSPPFGQFLRRSISVHLHEEEAGAPRGRQDAAIRFDQNRQPGTALAQRRVRAEERHLGSDACGAGEAPETRLDQGFGAAETFVPRGHL